MPTLKSLLKSLSEFNLDCPIPDQILIPSVQNEIQHLLEQRLLAALMRDDCAIEDIYPNDFWGISHLSLFECIKSLKSAGKKVSAIRVSEELRNTMVGRDVLMKAGDAYLLHLHRLDKGMSARMAKEYFQERLLIEQLKKKLKEKPA